MRGEDLDDTVASPVPGAASASRVGGCAGLKAGRSAPSPSQTSRGSSQSSRSLRPLPPALHSPRGLFPPSSSFSSSTSLRHGRNPSPKAGPCSLNFLHSPSLRSTQDSRFQSVSSTKHLITEMETKTASKYQLYGT